LAACSPAQPFFLGPLLLLLLVAGRKSFSGLLLFPFLHLLPHDLQPPPIPSAVSLSSVLPLASFHTCTLYDYPPFSIPFS
jgi:hypothetical protein